MCNNLSDAIVDSMCISSRFILNHVVISMQEAMHKDVQKTL